MLLEEKTYFARQPAPSRRDPQGKAAPFAMLKQNACASSLKGLTGWAKRIICHLSADRIRNWPTFKGN